MSKILSIPKLAKCDNRNVLAKLNSQIGGPDQWLALELLKSYGYASLCFDFFINWTAGRCANEIWIKRISEVPPADIVASGADALKQATESLGDDLATLHSFSEANNLSAYYKIFREGVDWTRPEQMLRAQVDATGFSNLTLHSLQAVMAAIRVRRGGPANIGSKGLMYGTSSLECYLSKTQDIWPGDADSVLWETAQKKVVAILEFKKHTLANPVSEQTLSKYYPLPDGRKYEALALLRDRLDQSAPIINVYYPTDPKHDSIKMEYIMGPSSRLIATKSHSFRFAGMDSLTVGRQIIDIVKLLIEGK